MEEVCEVPCRIEAQGFCDLGYWHIGGAKQVLSARQAYAQLVLVWRTAGLFGEEVAESAIWNVHFFG